MPQPLFFLVSSFAGLMAFKLSSDGSDSAAVNTAMDEASNGLLAPILLQRNTIAAAV